MLLDRKNLKYIGLALAGGLVGAGLGLLLAPRSGRETRRRIARSMGDGRDALLRNGHRTYAEVADYLRAS